jgi:ATP-dependent helicase HrpB
MIGAIRKLGIEILPWTNPVRALRSRSEWLRRVALVGNEWPDLSHRHLTETVGEWLGPHLGKVKKRSQLAHLDLLMIVRSMYTWNQLKDLDRLAPTHLVVPTGSNIPIDYDGGDLPVLAVRLQEMFGETQTPTVGGGKVKVQLHLLSPARRPLAVTQDLPSFWKNAYPAVRKDMRGRYPKHFWPEDPLQAEPTRRRKKS